MKRHSVARFSGIAVATFLFLSIHGVLAAKDKPSVQTVSMSVHGTGTSVDVAQKSKLLMGVVTGDFADDSGSAKVVTEHLSRAVGSEVDYRPVANWWEFQSALKRGEYQIVFAASHLAGWMTSRNKYEIVAQAQGDVSYAVIVRTDNAAISELGQLAGRRICAMAPPNLGTLAILHEFSNPARRPMIAAASNWNQVYENVFANRCDAGIVPVHWYASKLSGVTRKVHVSEPYPNTAVLVRNDVDAEIRRRIKEAVVSKGTDDAVIKLLGPGHLKSAFVVGDPAPYRDKARALEREWSW